MEGKAKQRVVLTNAELGTKGYKVTCWPGVAPDGGEYYSAAHGQKNLGGAFSADDAWEICRDDYEAGKS